MKRGILRSAATLANIRKTPDASVIFRLSGEVITFPEGDANAHSGQPLKSRAIFCRRFKSEVQQCSIDSMAE
jgi:hypothetical protein